MSDAKVSATIHERGDARLDAVVELVSYLAQPRPLATVLDEIPARVARVFASPVCSVYLREGNDLVMRGNVGFATEALGEVRLPTGDGLVGTAVETMRPVSTALASSHGRFRAFPTLGEERYPAFLAVPVPGASGPGGALVVQREGERYDARDVELLVALGGALAPILERARIIDGTAVPRGASPTGVRRVTLTGRSLRGGRALGIACAPQRPAARAGAERKASSKELGAAFERAVMQCDAILDRYARGGQRKGVALAALETDRVILADGRLRERVVDMAASKGLAGALAQAAREATRAARITEDPTLSERAQEMSELCDALRLLALPPDAVKLPKGAVWLADAVTVFDLVLATRAAPSAVVLASAHTGARTRALVELLDVPCVAEVAGVYNWATAGDVVLVDADHGLVRVNPTRKERDDARLSRG